MKILHVTATREVEFLALYPDDINVDELPAMLEAHAEAEFDVDGFGPEIEHRVLPPETLDKFVPQNWDDEALVYGRFLAQDVSLGRLRQIVAMPETERAQLELFKK